MPRSSTGTCDWRPARQEADASRAQEAARRQRHHLRDETLERSLIEPQRFHQRIEDVHHVVLRVVRVLPGIARGSSIMFPALMLREAQRVAEHIDQVVLHQQRLVLVDGQADVALGRIDDQVDARALDAGAGDELVDAFEQAQFRIGEVDRIDRVLRHRDRDRRPRHDSS